MSKLLTHDASPLSQAKAGRRAAVKQRPGQLPDHDEQLLRQLLESDYDYMDDPTFHSDDAERLIFDEAPEIPVPNTDWYHPLMNSGSDLKGLPRNEISLVLSAKQERALFLQYNYCRFRAAKHRAAIDPHRVDADEARQLLHWHKRAWTLRDQIANTNLALVLAMAKRFRGSELDYVDLISDGNMALLRAIDKFDSSRGYKLSTYACRAILKAFSRVGVKVGRYRQTFPAAFDTSMEQSDHQELKHQQHEEDCVDELRRIIRENKAGLTEVERKVITHRFQIDGSTGTGREGVRKMTLEQVGKVIGLTKERVRQIQHKAYEKLRSCLEAEFLT